MGTDEDFSAAGHDFVIEILKSACKYLVLQMSYLVFYFGQVKAKILRKISISRKIGKRKSRYPDSPGGWPAAFYLSCVLQKTAVFNKDNPVLCDKVTEGNFSLLLLLGGITKVPYKKSL